MKSLKSNVNTQTLEKDIASIDHIQAVIWKSERIKESFSEVTAWKQETQFDRIIEI